MVYTQRVTLDMRIPNGLQDLASKTAEEGSWTLAQAVADLKSRGLVRLFARDDAGVAELSDRQISFERAVGRGATPCMGDVLAAYYHAVLAQAEDDWTAERITDRQRAARVSAAGRIVFEKVASR